MKEKGVTNKKLMLKIFCYIYNKLWDYVTGVDKLHTWIHQAFQAQIISRKDGKYPVYVKND